MTDLITEIASISRLKLAWRHVKRRQNVTPGIDDIGIRDFEKDASKKLQKISQELKAGTYTFNKVVQSEIPKKRGSKEKRKIRNYCVCDKIVQTSLRLSLEGTQKNSSPLFPGIINDISIGYLNKLYFKGGPVGVKLAVNRIKALFSEGYKYFIKADLKDFFENMDRKELKRILFSKIPLNHITEKLVDDILHPSIITLDRYHQNSSLLPATSSGVAQGSVMAPLFSNLYLSEFDHALSQDGIKAIRYADDILLAAKNKKSAEKIIQRLPEILKTTARGLELHHRGTPKGPIIMNIFGGVEFLGIFIEKTAKNNRWSIRPMNNKIKEIKENINRILSPKSKENLYPRLHYLNNSIKGWLESYRYSGCTHRNMRKIYDILKDQFEKQVEHLLRVKGISRKSFTKAQIEFLGILPPRPKSNRRRFK